MEWDERTRRAAVVEKKEFIADSFFAGPSGFVGAEALSDQSANVALNELSGVEKKRKSAATFPVDGRVGGAGIGVTKRIRVFAGGFLPIERRFRSVRENAKRKRCRAS